MDGMAPIRRPRRSTLSDDVYDVLKALVMENGLTPGERINIEALARQMDVSPTPVREGLARLESEGLVRKRSLTGYIVTPVLTEQQFHDLVENRLLLEGTAARWAAERAGADQRAAIIKAGEESIAPEDEDADKWRNHAQFTALDARFHALVAEASGSPLLAENINRLHAHLHLVRLYFPHSTASVTYGEHMRIAEAIRASQADEAEAAMRDHLSNGRERHMAVFGK